MKHGPGRWLAIAWLLVGLGGALLLASYSNLPAEIPAYRDLHGEVVLWVPRTPRMALRVAAMGVGQLGACAAMARAADQAAHGPWTRFWTAAALAAAMKTLLECAQLASLGWDLPAAPWMILTLAPVLVFLGYGASLWRKGSLTKMGALSRPQRLLVAGSLLLWLTFATLPRW